MKKIVLTCIIILSISVLQAQSNGISDMDFTAVDIDLPGNIIIYQTTGEVSWGVKSSNSNYFNVHILRKVVEGKLFLYMDDNAPQVKLDLQVEIKLPVLKELSMHGACDVLITTRNEPQLSILHYGSGNCNITALNIGEFLEMHNNGLGNIKTLERINMQTGENIPPSAPIISTKSLLIHNSGTGNISLESCSANSVVINNLGTGDVFANMLNTETEAMTLQNKGTGELNLLNLNVKQLGLKNTGTSDVHLNGEAESLRLFCNGIGDIKAQSLVVKTAHITNSGTGYIQANVTDTAYIFNDCKAMNYHIIGGGKVVRECFKKN